MGMRRPAILAAATLGALLALPLAAATQTIASASIRPGPRRPGGS